MATSPPGLNHIRARLISVRRPCLAGDRPAHMTIGGTPHVNPRAGQVSDTSPDVSPQIRRLRCLPTPDGGSSVTYALSRRADAVRGSRNAADDLEPAPASALLSGSVGWRGRDSSSVAATQLPRTRRPADRRAVRPASCQAAGVGVGIERLGREYRTAHLRTGDQRRLKATAGNDDQAAICLRLSGDNARVLIEVWDADPQPPVPKDRGEDGTPTLKKRAGAGCS